MLRCAISHTLEQLLHLQTSRDAHCFIYQLLFSDISPSSDRTTASLSSLPAEFHYTVTRYSIQYSTLATTYAYASAFPISHSSPGPSPSSLSPAVARLASKNVLSEFFSGPSNVPLCANTYVCNNLQT